MNMLSMISISLAVGVLLLFESVAPLPQYTHHTQLEHPTSKAGYVVSYDPRPYYLINNLTEGLLRTKLESCQNGPFSVSGFSIGHRGGATLQIPEETVENTMAGARFGAGILECDVAFTKDLGLVCRHDLCDLHSTTDILVRPELAAKCTQAFTPANETDPASAMCCTSDITAAEFTSLCGKMDGFNKSAVTPEDFVSSGTPAWRTDLYATCGTVMTLESYITLVDSLPGYRNFTPELKTPPSAVPMPFNGTYTQSQYARDMLDTFIRLGIAPERVWPQSFLPADIFQWIIEYPSFGNHAIYLDQDGDDLAANYTAAIARLPSLKERGVNIIAPPFSYLLSQSPLPSDSGPPTSNNNNNYSIIPSPYALAAKAANLDIITWSLERSGPLSQVASEDDYYYSSILNATSYDGQLYEVLDILVQQVGIKGLFSDWSSTVGYYANCFGLPGLRGEDYA